MSDQATMSLRVGLADDADAAALDEATARLRRDLLELDVDNVERATGAEAPPGTKAVETILIGTLLVTLAKNAGTIGEVVKAVQGWLGDRPGRTVKLELDGDAIELSNASSEDQKRLLDLWIEQHATRT
jgi:hypothetical protein